MSLHCFAIPALQPEPAQSELNAFLAQARVLALQRALVPDGAASFWAVCVEVAQGPHALPAALAARGEGKLGATNVDYKQLLSPEDFALFAALRDLRKQLAQRDGVPVYAVLTNEQLAAVAQRRPTSLAELAQVEGLGPARLQKYGAAVLQGVADTLHPPAAPAVRP